MIERLAHDIGAHRMTKDMDGDAAILFLRRKHRSDPGVDEIDRCLLGDVELGKIGGCLGPRRPVEADDRAGELISKSRLDVALLRVDAGDREIIAVYDEQLPLGTPLASAGKVAMICLIHALCVTACVGAGMSPSGTTR
jgi:hypothetical protein